MEKEIIELQKYRKLSEERWEMLKDYLKVEEEDYAELIQDKDSGFVPSISLIGGRIFKEDKAVKKTKLVPSKGKLGTSKKK
jgi:hypothetical protein